MERIGIYGGTFNPPHMGHILAATEAVKRLNLDRVLLIPDRIAPHKQLPEDSASPEQRLAMLKIAADTIPNLEVSDLELRREGKSYTYLTMLALREQYPHARFVLLMGTDMFLSFDRWMHPEIILEHASLGVLYRGEKSEQVTIEVKKQEMEAAGAEVALVKNAVLPLSSTDLRRLLVFGCGDSYLPAGVGEYIRRHGLYSTGESYKGLSMEQLEQTVIRLLHPNRVNHVLGCRDTAVALAKQWGAEETDAARAALLHDITKALGPQHQLTLVEEYGKILDDFSRENPKVLHALTGSLVAERIFGENEQVVQAVRWHTTGRPYMSLLEKIIYVADYMEPNRNFPSVERLRQLAFTDLDEAVRQGVELTISMLKKQGSRVSPVGEETLSWLNGKRKDEGIC